MTGPVCYDWRMIAPLFVFIADLALWLLWSQVWQFGDEFLTLIVFGLAFSFLIWFLIEFYQLVTSFAPDE